MVSKIEDTCMKLHPKPTQVKTNPVFPSVASTPRPVRPVIQPPTASQPKAQPQITQTAFTINIGDGVKKVWIPNAVKDVFTNEVQIPEDNNIATTENVAHVAMLLFAGYINAATSISESCGGGGSSPSLVGARKTMKMIGRLPTVVHRWLMPCVSLNHAAEVSTDKSMTIWQSERAR